MQPYLLQTEEMIMAGFGGQGVLSMGMTLAYAGMLEGKEISWMPSYGPEMRGGTANCITILSTDSISSPIVSFFDTAVLLNQPSMDKFGQKVKPGGILIYEADAVIKPENRTDITMVPVKAMQIALHLAHPKGMNMVMLGVLLGIRPMVECSSIEAALYKVLPEKYHTQIALNTMALMAGVECGASIMQKSQSLQL